MFKVSEKNIQSAILDYLRMRGYVCKRNNAGMASYTYKGQNRWFKVGDAGWPDIEGITRENQKTGLRGGLYFGIEVKTQKGILSDIQRSVGQQILDSGGLWFVARSVDDVISNGF